MKKLIIGMIAALTAIAGYSATDAELKAMLDAKDYAKFAYTAYIPQLTNLATSADAQYICEAISMTNQIQKSIALCQAKLIDWKSATDIAIAKQNPEAFNIACMSNDDELILNTWEKVLDIPTTSIEMIYKYINSRTELKLNHLELTKKTANILLSQNSRYYTHFVFNGYKNFTDEYKLWAASCVKNVNEDRCTLSGWRDLLSFDKNLLKNENYYYPNMWKRNKFPKIRMLYILLHKTPYYSKAVAAIASSITDPQSASYIAKIIDACENNKKLTIKLYPVISKDIHLACEAACYLNNTDKVIDIMLNAGEDLTAEELNKMIPMINALDVDYRSAEVIKALRNINSRYTLRLYNEREVWEPILSKIRAMIDVRQ